MEHSSYIVEKRGLFWRWVITQGCAAPARGAAFTVRQARSAARNRIRRSFSLASVQACEPGRDPT